MALMPILTTTISRGILVGVCLVVVCCQDFAFASNNPAREETSKLQAGAAASNITPPIGGGIVGGFVPVPSTHVHDELNARCLVLDDGQTRIALVVCDLLGIHRSVSDRARELIESRLGIPKTNVLISATHTHSATSALGQARYQMQIELDEYQLFVVQRIVDGVQRAINNLEPAEIAFGSAEAPEHVFNRRWRMREGTVPLNPFGGQDQVRMNPPAGSPDLLEPAGPTDPTISFFAVRSITGRPISLYAAYSLHYVGGAGAGHISADYFGRFCKSLNELTSDQDLDPPFVPMLANGTSGDINNINFRTPRPGQPPYTQINAVADDVARQVHLAMMGLTWQNFVPLNSRYREVNVRWRRPTQEQLDWAREKLQEPIVESRKADLPRIYAERTMAMAEQPESGTIPVQVLHIGSLRIGSLPCEVLVEIGLEFRERSVSQPAFLVSMAHGYFGYLPTPEQHELGGYETWLGTNRMDVDSSVLLLEQLIEMTAQ